MVIIVLLIDNEWHQTNSASWLTPDMWLEVSKVSHKLEKQDPFSDHHAVDAVKQKVYHIEFQVL